MYLPVILPVTIYIIIMAKTSIPIREIRSLCRKTLQEHGLKAATISSYKCSVSTLITFMEHEQIAAYTPTVGVSLMRHVRFDESFSCVKRNDIYKCVKLLNFILGEMPSPLIRPARIKYEYAVAFKGIIERFLVFYKSSGRSEFTLSSYAVSLSRFSISMEMKGRTPHTITRQDLVDFFSSINKYKTVTITAIKYFCRFMYREGIQPDDFQPFFKMFSRMPRKEKILSFYMPEEVFLIENAINRNTEIGKRDYAMILLASRLGLRSSDIRGLLFSDIDWDNNTINLIQHKTQRHLSLPLLKDVGEALVDYIQNSRPHCRHKRVFLTHDFPYDGITTEMLHRIVSSYIQKAGISNGHRHHGPHALRHSLATNLMNNGETLPVISGILGHVATQHTMEYLTVDIKGLLHCSLTVPSISETFYTQGGDLFFDYD